MAEEDRPPTAEARPEQPPSGAEDRPRTDGQDSSTRPGPPEGQQEGKTRGLLREAIQKVMEEIEHHEKEAQKHLHQAQELRKELRESIAFLQAEGGKGQATEPSSSIAEQGTEDKREDVGAGHKGPRAGSKKQPGEKKARGK